MGRGEHLCYGHHDFFAVPTDTMKQRKKESDTFSQIPIGRLVLLGFDISAYTPAAYQGHRL